MRIVAILQARMNSTRLPGKVMLPLAGKSMLLNIVERVSRAKRVHKVIVAAPQRDVGDMLCQGFSVVFYNGDENDLLGRYLDAAEYEKADIIIRVPCDNPVIDPAYIDQAIESYLASPWIFYSNTTVRMNCKWVDGLGCEVFSMSRLRWLDKIATSPLQREHPHSYFRDAGLIHWYQDWSQSSITETLRLDVNDQADYDFINSIYNHFGHNNFTALDILNCPPVQERLHGR